jgi:hypothetical protein
MCSIAAKRIYSPKCLERGLLGSSGVLVAALTLRSVLLKHAAYILHQSFKLPHPFLTKLLDAFVLYARYDLISYPP